MAAKYSGNIYLVKIDLIVKFHLRTLELFFLFFLTGLFLWQRKHSLKLNQICQTVLAFFRLYLGYQCWKQEKKYFQHMCGKVKEKSAKVEVSRKIVKSIEKIPKLSSTLQLYNPKMYSKKIILKYNHFTHVDEYA